jgi:hypothetical protein
VITAKGDRVRLEPNSLNRQQLVLFIDGEVFWTNTPGPSVGEPSVDGPSVSKGEVIRVEAAVCAERLVFLRYGAYDFYGHVSRTFFRGEGPLSASPLPASPLSATSAAASESKGSEDAR